MAKIETLFLTKTAKKPHPSEPLICTHNYIAHIKEYPTPETVIAAK